MIFLDANIFLRYFAPSSDPLTLAMQDTASNLFLQIEAGNMEATTSELVLHDVLSFMTAKQHYNVPVEQAVDMIEYAIRMRGFQLAAGEQSTYLRALALWKSRPSLGFADLVIAARCEINGWELATFDEQLGSLPNLTRWNPGLAS
jgi:predicted nucleic acid-binding protein